ncbi:hypothetical protein ES708_10810 [subsurface metagenome]
MTSKGHALSRDALIRTLTAYSGITTENGEGDGTTLVDSNLKDNALIAPTSIPEKTILIMTGDARGEDKGATDFDNSDGKITLQGTGFSHQIKAGTIFRVLNISTIEIDVARIEAKIDTLETRVLCSMDFWSLPQEEVALTGAAGDKALPSVTVEDLPDGATIVRAIAMFKFRMVENHTYAGVNSLDGAQAIQVATSVDAINFVDAQFTLAQDTREGGDVVIGVIDIAATVNANGAYAFHWDLAKALQTGINFNDVQMGIRIWYSV